MKPHTRLLIAALSVLTAAAACAPPPPATLPQGRPAHTPKLLLVGDSIAYDLRPAARSEAGRLGYRLVDVPAAAPLPGCVVGGSVFTDAARRTQCDAHRAGWAALVARERPDVVLVVRHAGRQAGLHGVPGAHRCDPAYLAWYRDRLRDDANVLGAHGATVVFATAGYNRAFGVVDAQQDNDLDCTNAATREVAATGPRTGVIELADWVCPTRSCRTHEGPVVLRADGLHHTGDGARLAMQWMWGRIYK